MWLFTTIGFFSAVADKDDPAGVVVRARVREDAEALAEATGRALHVTPRADYRFRVFLRRSEWERFVAAQAAAIDYDNFKKAVGIRQGDERAHAYAAVWAVMFRVQQDREP